jgi:type II secretory pathway pseudopilin PulG
MTRRDRLMILSILAVVLLGGFYMLVLSPQRKASKTAQAELIKAQTSLTEAQARLDSGRAAQQAFRRDRTTIVKLGRVVPESDDIPTLITQLQALAKRYHVNFTSFGIDASGGGAAKAPAVAVTSTSTTTTGAGKTSTSSTAAVAPLYPPGSVEVSGGLGRTAVLISLTGKYFNLEQYLRAVQRFAVLSANRESAKGRLMIVDGFSYKNKEAIGGLLKADLGASVYFAPPIETPAAAAAVDPAAATPASGTGATSSTGPAAVGGLR